MKILVYVNLNVIFSTFYVSKTNINFNVSYNEHISKIKLKYYNNSILEELYFHNEIKKKNLQFFKCINQFKIK